MVRIARRVPACRDAEVAELAPTLLIAQLDRVLRALPEQPDGSTERPEPERVMRVRDGRDGWTRGEFCLPADEGALVRLGLTAARDAEFRDRNDLDPDDRGDAEIDGLANGARAVSWADGLVRMATEAADALDPTFARTGQRSDRNTIVLHVDVDPDGTHGPAQLELAHHIHFWEHGGVTEPSNLTMLCAHHRALHAGEFTIDGDPEAGTLRFLDPWGHPITAPEPRPPEPPPPPTPFTPPLAERLQSDWFTWN